jgi:hypothetical protein
MDSNIIQKKEENKQEETKKESIKKNEKTKYQRVSEIVKSWKKLRELGLSDDLPALIEFKKVTNQFIEDGHPVTGKIPMPEWDRTLCYILTNHSKKESTIALMANRK